MRAIAIIAPGMFLSQPPTQTTPSIIWPFTAVSIASAITSRETSEYFMPSVPMPIPSVTVGKPKTWGMAPAALTAAIARSTSGWMPALQGFMVEWPLATPTIALSKSPSPNPTARSIARLGERASPWVIVLLRQLSLMWELLMREYGLSVRLSFYSNARTARLPHHARPSEVRSGRDPPRPPGDPLVRSHVPGGLRPGILAGAAAHQAGKSRPRDYRRPRRSAVLRRPGRGHRRPARLRALLQARLLLFSSARDPGRVARRDVFSRRIPGRAARGLVGGEKERAAMARDHRFPRAAQPACVRRREARELHQRRAAGPRHHRALGHDFRRRGAPRAPPFTALPVRPGGRAAVRDPVDLLGQAQAVGGGIGSLPGRLRGAPFRGRVLQRARTAV